MGPVKPGVVATSGGAQRIYKDKAKAKASKEIRESTGKKGGSGPGGNRLAKLQTEKESELTAIWGGDKNARGQRLPFRRGRKKRMAQGNDEDEVFSGSDDEGNPIAVTGAARTQKAATHDTKKEKKEKSAKKKAETRLHCFVGPGTHKNQVREVFDLYEPGVDIRTAQKGNALNRTTYAVLTFPNKAMAYHAVLTLDGTDQSALLGVKALKMGVMVPRDLRKQLERKRHSRGGDGGAVRSRHGLPAQAKLK